MPNVKQTINKNWYLLRVNSILLTAFDGLIESMKILDGKVVRENSTIKQLYFRPCLGRRDKICCLQVLKTKTFTS